MTKKLHTPFAKLFGARPGGVGYPARQAKPAKQEPALTRSSVKSARAAERRAKQDFSHLANPGPKQVASLAEWQASHHAGFFSKIH